MRRTRRAAWRTRGRRDGAKSKTETEARVDPYIPRCVALPPSCCGRIGDADQMGLQCGEKLRRTVHSVPNIHKSEEGGALMPMTGFSDFVQQTHNFIVSS